MKEWHLKYDSALSWVITGLEFAASLTRTRMVITEPVHNGIGVGGRGKDNRKKDMASACSPIHRPSVMTASVKSLYVPATVNQRRYFVCYISAEITFPFRHSCCSPSDLATFRCQHWSCTCMRRFFCLVRFQSKALRKCSLVRTELSYPKGSLDADI